MAYHVSLVNTDKKDISSKLIMNKEKFREFLFKEFKKALLKKMQLPKFGTLYVGKSLIENKEKYRLVYGSPNSPIDADYNISDMVWKEKGKKKK